MSSISLNGDTSGSILIQAPAVAGSGTLTLPTGTATLGIAGPAFSVYASAAQLISNATETRLTQFDTETFDTANCFSSSRFTPNVAGYYLLTAQVGCSGTATAAYIAKNGVTLKGSSAVAPLLSGWGSGANPTSIAYANGTTDYFDVYVYQASGGSVNAYTNNSFSGCLIRAA